MHSSNRSVIVLGMVVMLGASLGVSPAWSRVLSNKQNPTSKFYVADTDGQAQLDTGDKVEDLTKKTVHDAQGVTVVTKKDSTNAMVYSNGTGIFFDQNTKVEVKRFVQEPFTPNRNDMSVEPSISNTYAQLRTGSVGLCTSKLVAGSSMTYATNLGSVSIRGGKVSIQASDGYTKVSLVEGDVTVRGGALDMGGQTLKPGQQAIITPGTDGGPSKVTIQPIPPKERSAIENQCTMACMAKNTVYFDVVGRKDSGSEGGDGKGGDGGDDKQEIVAKPVSPDTLPTDFTVSPSRIGNP